MIRFSLVLQKQFHSIDKHCANLCPLSNSNSSQIKLRIVAIFTEKNMGPPRLKLEVAWQQRQVQRAPETKPENSKTTITAVATKNVRVICSFLAA